MDMKALQGIFTRRPYQPHEIVLDNGDRFLVPHPEAIFLNEFIVVFVEPDGEIHLLDPEAISEVRRPPRRRKPARERT